MFFLLRSWFWIGLVLFSLSGKPARQNARQHVQAVAAQNAQPMAQHAANLCLAHPQGCLALAAATQGTLPAKPATPALVTHKSRAPANTLSAADAKPVWRGKLPEH